MTWCGASAILESRTPLLEALMTLYMDVHEALPAGTTAADVAGAHAQDLLAPVTTSRCGT